MNATKVLKAVFCGTPEFCLPSLEVLAFHPHIQLTKIISMPDRPAGRGQNLQAPPVAEFAKKHRIPLFQTANLNKEESLIQELEGQQVDLIIVLAFAQFLNSRILNLPKIGCFNIHTSILPKYRGAAPIQHALLNDEKETGVTIQKMVKKMDAGDIAQLDKLPISPFDTAELLSTRLKFQAGLTLYTFIDKIFTNKLSFSSQDESQVTYAPSLKKEDGYLNFEETSSTVALNKVRGFYPWPGTYCTLNGKRLIIHKASLENIKIPPGKVNTDFGTLLIGCKKGTLRLQEIQWEGKKKCFDSELLRGLRGEIFINRPATKNEF